MLILKQCLLPSLREWHIPFVSLCMFLSGYDLYLVIFYSYSPGTIIWTVIQSLQNKGSFQLGRNTYSSKTDWWLTLSSWEGCWLKPWRKKLNFRRTHVMRDLQFFFSLLIQYLSRCSHGNKFIAVPLKHLQRIYIVLKPKGSESRREPSGELLHSTNQVTKSPEDK